jgi:hypothetical protein
MVGLLGGCTARPVTLAPSERAVSAPAVAPTLGTSIAPASSIASVTPASSTSARHNFTPGTRMLDVTGQRLSDAYQRLAEVGFTSGLVRAIDGSDQDRVVLNTVNWIIDAQTPQASSIVNERTVVTLTVTKPTDGKGDRTATPGVVPNVVCKDAEGAVNLLRVAGFRDVALIDGTGERRGVIVHQNWVVTRQSTAPASRPDATTKITLEVVKYGEPTGDSRCAS